MCGWELGLYLVRLVAQVHQGKTWFKSSKETGTIFLFRLRSSPINKAKLYYSQFKLCFNVFYKEVIKCIQVEKISHQS